ncbi:MAG: hypothetical protein JWP65_546 [Ramlibacter sp.]|jgi:uncharacterized membrane protein YeaQ/YmgE (transglycosylase-associated protein family)|uniref:GlsB/YeaQ/YmgE family stress response membrane protein n=1 Tax=Ramlibacter sp. TaxID=1917967 RepID=UPI002628B69C|nr:hypothetical protein [Ramlibacter sp.]MDB5750125.1 hypothetical protein [Ramlibacter sp.]
MGSNGKTVRIEEICVGIFGAFIGGEFLPSVLSETGTVAPGFSGMALMTGVAGAAVMLVLLKLMRRTVGPMRDSKSRMTKR